jgi:cytochrome P450
MASNLSSLVLGAFETTIFSVGNSVHALLRHPDQLDVLRNDPSLIECATEELLRFDAPLQFTTPRTAPDDLDICGVRLRAGESILPMLGAANRDPAHVDDPDRLDLRRPARPLAFGAGIHHCIGAGLARIEIQEAIAGLVGRFSQIEMVDDAVEWVPSVAFRGPRALHLAVAA